MKTMFGLAIAAAAGLVAAAAPICNCGEAPERANDFFWENDRVGFRAYGPGETRPWSGIDLFNKLPGAASVGDLLRGKLVVEHNWHETPCSGILDNYTIGASRGVGGVAIKVGEEWMRYPVWKSYRVIHVGDDYLEFELVYPACSPAGKMTLHVTMRRGESFFRGDVGFEKPMTPDMLAGPGLDVATSRQHRGSIREDDGAISLAEEAKQGNGSTMSAVMVADPAAVEVVTDAEGCRVLAFARRQRFTYWAGADWSKGGRISKLSDWHKAVRAFLEKIRKNKGN